MEQMLGKSLKEATDKEIFTVIKDSKNAEFVNNIIKCQGTKINLLLKVLALKIASCYTILK